MNIFDSQDSTFLFDFEKSNLQFSKNAMKKISVGKFKKDGKLVEVEIEGEVSTNGISSNKFGTKSVYSIGVRIEDLGVDVSIDQLRLSIADKFPADIAAEFTYSPLIKDDIIYFKLKPSANNREFVVKSNKKLDMKKLADYPPSGTIVKVTSQLQGWVNLEDKKYGVMFVVKSLEFIED
jgi:hypothetical protein